MVEAQGGDARALADPESLLTGAVRTKVRATRSGHVARMDCEQIGRAVQRLGAGRERAEDHVSPLAGLEMHVQVGGPVQAGAPLCTLYAADASKFAEAEQMLHSALVIEDAPPGTTPPLLYQVVTRDNCGALRTAHHRR
jgi:pyrimidine-nucleoside phosphorylase